MKTLEEFKEWIKATHKGQPVKPENALAAAYLIYMQGYNDKDKCDSTDSEEETIAEEEEPVFYLLIRNGFALCYDLSINWLEIPKTLKSASRKEIREYAFSIFCGKCRSYSRSLSEMEPHRIVKEWVWAENLEDCEQEYNMCVACVRSEVVEPYPLTTDGRISNCRVRYFLW